MKNYTIYVPDYKYAVEEGPEYTHLKKLFSEFPEELKGQILAVMNKKGVIEVGWRGKPSPENVAAMDAHLPGVIHSFVPEPGFSSPPLPTNP